MYSIILRNPTELFLVEELISRFVSEYSGQEKNRHYLAIVCDEIISNIFNYNDSEVTVEVSFACSQEDITLSFTDNGKIFNPAEHQMPSEPDRILDREIGGLGISLVKKLSDEVSYKTMNHKNCLTVKKRF